MTTNSITDFAVIQKKLDALTKLFDETAQAYHNLAHMINEDRHKSSNWVDCDEETCKAAGQYYTQNVL